MGVLEESNYSDSINESILRKLGFETVSNIYNRYVLTVQLF